MAAKEHQFTIKFAGDNSDVLLTIREIEAKAKELGVTLKDVFQSISQGEDNNFFTQGIKIASDDLNKVKDAAIALSKWNEDNAKLLSGKIATTDDIQLEKLRERIALRKLEQEENRKNIRDQIFFKKLEADAEKEVFEQRLKNAKEVNVKAVKDLQEKLNLEQIIRENGEKSVAAIKERARQKELSLQKDLFKEIDKIEQQFAKGSFNFTEQGRKRNKAIEDNIKRINNLRDRTKKSIDEEIKRVQHIKDQIRFGKELIESTNKATGAQRKHTFAVKETVNETKHLLDANKSLLRHIFDVAIRYKAINATLSGIRRSIEAVPAAGISQQATSASLEGTFGTVVGKENLQFVQDTAEKMGQNLRGLEESYRLFAPSARLAGASQEQVNKIFEDFAAIGTVLHKTPDEMKSVFLAIEQMFAKTTVQSEEVKRQLGNQLPAALEIFAAANEMSVAQFMKSMERNEIIAKEAVPKFSAMYRVIFAGQEDSILGTVRQRTFANFQRFLNRLENLARSIFERLEPTIISVLKVINRGLDVITENLEGIVEIASFAAAALTARLVTAIASVGTAAITNGVKILFFNKVLHGITGEIVRFDRSSTKEVFGKLATGANIASKAILGVPIQVTAVLAAVAGLTIGIAALGGVSLGYGKVVKATEDDLAKLNELIKGQGVEAQAAKILLNNLNQESAGIIVNFGTVQATIGETVSAVWTLTKRSIDDVLDDLKTSFKEFSDYVIDTIIPPLTEAWDKFTNLISSTAAILITAGGRGLPSLFGLGTGNSFIEDVRKVKKVLNDTAEDFSKPENDIFFHLNEGLKTGVNEARKTIKSGMDTVADEIERAREESVAKQFKIIKDGIINPFPIPENEGSTDSGKGNKSGLKNLLNEKLAQLKEEAALVTENNRLIEGLLKNSYDNQLLSVREFYEEKFKLIRANHEAEDFALKKSIELAKQFGDNKKVFDLQRERAKAETTNILELLQLNQQKIEQEEKISDIIRETSITLLKLQGNELEALDLANTKKSDKVKLLEAEARAGSVAAEQALVELKLIEQANRALKESDVSAKRFNKTKASLKDAEEAINRQLEIGIINSRQASTAFFNIRDAKLKAYDEEILKLEEILKKNENILGIEERLTDVIRDRNAVRASGGGQADRILQEFGGGDFDFISKFTENLNSLKLGKQADLDTLNGQSVVPFQDATITLQEKLDAQAALHEKNSLAIAGTYTNMFGGISKLGSDTFQGLTDAAVSMYGAQSKAARKAFMIQKAFRIAETIMFTAQAVVAQLANPTPYVGIALAAVAAAMGAAQVAQIASQQPPAAHGGLTTVPKEQTYLLDKGERVVSPKQNVALTKAVNKINGNGGFGQQASSEPRFRIINAIDPNILTNFLGSRESEEVIINIVRSNLELA